MQKKLLLFIRGTRFAELNGDGIGSGIRTVFCARLIQGWIEHSKFEIKGVAPIIQARPLHRFKITC